MPFKPDERQYRSLTGSLSAMADTSDGSKAYRVEGYATTFDAPYELYKNYEGEPVYECIRSTALAGADMSDIIFQLNHEGHRSRACATAPSPSMSTSTAWESMPNSTAPGSPATLTRPSRAASSTA